MIQYNIGACTHWKIKPPAKFFFPSPGDQLAEPIPCPMYTCKLGLIIIRDPHSTNRKIHNDSEIDGITYLSLRKSL